MSIINFPYNNGSNQPSGDSDQDHRNYFGELVVRALQGCEDSIADLSSPIPGVSLREIVREGLTVSLGIEYHCPETGVAKYFLSPIIEMQQVDAHLLPERVQLSKHRLITPINYYNQ